MSSGASNREVCPGVFFCFFFPTGNTLIVFFFTARRHLKSGDFEKAPPTAPPKKTKTVVRRHNHFNWQLPWSDIPPLEAREYKLKLQGTDRRAPPGERAARGLIWLNTGNLTRSDAEMTDRLIALSRFCGQRRVTALRLMERFVRLIPIIINK